MATTVQVLCPNGRRQTIKVTPNTKLLQVLEEACKKQGFLPPEDYSLKHGRNVVDVTQSFRFSNLPQNVKLELIKLESTRVESNVVIALQLENGERVQNEFTPATTLWEIVKSFESQEELEIGSFLQVDSSVSPPVHPTCIYMREEVIGEEGLKNMTLRKLGLTQGKAAIRLVRRAVRDEQIAQILDTLNREKLKEEKLESIAAQKLQSTEAVQAGASTSCQQSAISKSEYKPESSVSPSRDKPEPMDTDDTSVSAVMFLPQQPMDTLPSGKTKKAKSDVSMKSVDAEESGKSLGELLFPGQNFHLLDEDGASNINNNIRMPGIEIIPRGQIQGIPTEYQQIARQMLQNLVGQQPQEHGSSAVSVKGQRRELAGFSSVHFSDFKFPEETKGQELYQNEYSDVAVEEYQPCDRETLVFSLEEKLLKTENQDSQQKNLPDDFFDITESDLKVMLRDKKNQMQTLENQPLMTRSLKQYQQEASYSHYKKSVIRIQFPDKMVLQAVFNIRETVHSVEKFVKENLENPSCSFYLYTTPPKHILKDKAQTLIQAKLIPAAVILFGSSTSQEHYLSTKVLSDVSSRLRAEEIVYKYLTVNPTEESAESETLTAGSSKPKQKPSTSQSSNQSKGEGKVPAWLKMGKK